MLMDLKFAFKCAGGWASIPCDYEIVPGSSAVRASLVRKDFKLKLWGGFSFSTWGNGFWLIESKAAFDSMLRVATGHLKLF